MMTTISIEWWCNDVLGNISREVRLPAPSRLTLALRCGLVHVRVVGDGVSKSMLCAG